MFTRRTFLLASGLVAVAGCRAGRRRVPAVDPDAEAWANARDIEAKIVAALEARATSSDAVAPIYAAALARHRAHLAALGGAPPSNPEGPVPPVAATVQVLQQAAVTVQSGTKAALLASIAASHLAEGVKP